MPQIDPRALRSAFGGFMTGVTVVTALRPDLTPVGFTANSFSSVSLDPPLLLVCPGKFLSSYETFANCRHFAVNVLAEGQEAVSNLFASSKGDRFAQIAHSADLHGVPLINGAAVQFSCKTDRILSAGDHCILIGEVADFTNAGMAGLGYVEGKYFSRGLERAAFQQDGNRAICGAIIEDGDCVLLVQTDAGLQPPQGTHYDRGHLIAELRETLSRQGITAELGQAYSVFDSTDPSIHHAYFLGKGHLAEPSKQMVAVPIAHLANQNFATPAIARMMTRFALERRTRNFALYLGNTEDGAIHQPDIRI